MAIRKKKTPTEIIGWREWVALPGLVVPHVKAKIDTGARSSSLHAFDLTSFRRRGAEWIRFKVHPQQRDTKQTIETKAKVLEYRKVRSSNGHSSMRPVILTTLSWNKMLWEIELTLSGRDEMGFRMLLGREAVRSRFIVDAGGSWYGGKPAAVKKTKTKTKKKKKKPGV